MRPRVTDAGFTLIEVLLALVMLSVVVLGSTATSAGLIRAAGTDRRASQAGAAVDARIVSSGSGPTTQCSRASPAPSPIRPFPDGNGGPPWLAPAA